MRQISIFSVIFILALILNLMPLAASAQDTDDDGLPDAQEAYYGGNYLDPDTDDDGLEDGEEAFTYYTLVYSADSDSDDLSDYDEVIVWSTDPNDSDTDDDLIIDGFEAKYASACGLDPATSGDTMEDPDGDNLINVGEYVAGSNPCEEDTDNDGLSDAWECGIVVAPGPDLVLDTTTPSGDDINIWDMNLSILSGDNFIPQTTAIDDDIQVMAVPATYSVYFITDPTDWDSDDDGLPDGYEFAHAEDSPALDPTDGSDGADDFDSDGNSNVNEYYNGTDPWTADPSNHQSDNNYSCFYWGDSDGDGCITSTDLGVLNSLLQSGNPSFANVIPSSSKVMDLDGSGYFSSADYWVEYWWVLSDDPTVYSRPVDITVIDAPSSVSVGDTVRVTVHAENGCFISCFVDPAYTAGIGIKFSIGASSTATATVVGGDGVDDGDRYDYTMDGDDSPASIVLIPTSTGTLYVDPVIEPCGTDGYGRYINSSVTASGGSIEITVTE